MKMDLAVSYYDSSPPFTGYAEHSTTLQHSFLILVSV